MKARHLPFGALLATTGSVFVWQCQTPEPTILAFHVGESFEEVARNSTYPVLKRSNLPAEDPSGDKFGATWVTEPAVIIRFNDPHHGFTLPATKFAALSFSENKAATLATSPMLNAVPFDEAVDMLEKLQIQFKAGGWTPWKGDESEWFDLTPEGKMRLYAKMFELGYSESQELRVPNKYAMTFRLKCAKGCWEHKPPYRFLIDIGVGEDVHAWWDRDLEKCKLSLAPCPPGAERRK